jgi:gamma-glutamylcyclotransferase
MLNFAYGSNLLLSRIRERVPGVQLVGTAVLAHHQLRWHKRGQDGSGKCDVVARRGFEVHGVLYEVPPDEKPGLDLAEGLGHGYDERRVTVRCGGDDLVCTLYQATQVDLALAPYSWYKALVLAGARQHALPADYVDTLAAVVAVQDVDAARHARHMALAADLSFGPQRLRG